MDTQDEFFEQEPNIPETVQQEMIRAQVADFARVAQSLVNAGNKIRRLPEPYFYMVLFPIIRDHFTGKTTDRIREWLNIADGMFKEIVVYDDLTNEELFTVPPFNQVTEPVLLQRENGKRVVSPNDMVEMQEIHRKNGEFRRFVEIEEALSKVYPVNGQSVSAKWVKNLIAIWNRYELPLTELFGDNVDAVLQAIADTPLEVTSTSTQSQDDTTESSDPMDYDF